jgi:hypothetical protein
MNYSQITGNCGLKLLLKIIDNKEVALIALHRYPLMRAELEGIFLCG